MTKLKFGRPYKSYTEEQRELLEEISKILRNRRVTMITATQRPRFHNPPLTGISSRIHPTYTEPYIRWKNINDVIITDHIII